MQHDTGPTRWWRPALCVVTIFWLAGHYFFPEGHTHLKVFGCFLVPLVFLNIDAIPSWRRIGPWFGVLAALLLWQVIVSTCYSRQLLTIGGPLDALSTVLFLLAVGVLARTRYGWEALRWTLFIVAVATMAWSLVNFYPIRGAPLGGERLRNVLVYPEGLSPVLTGLLSGFGMLVGMTLASVHRTRLQRLALWPGIGLLAFAMMATQTRGALLAASAGTIVLLWRTKRAALPGIAAAVAGILVYLVAFAILGDDAAVPDLAARGTSGRPEIWSIYLDRLHGLEWIFGQGSAVPLDESILGWYVHHPHSSYVTQLVHSGIPGLLLLGTFALGALWAAWRKRESGAAAFSLLAFGLTCLLVDGALIVSMFSIPRIEPLLVLVPAIFALSHGRGPPSRRSG